MSKIALEHIFSGNTGPLAPLDTPSGVEVRNIGTSGATTYGYRISALNGNGETLASATVTTTTGHATLNSTNYNRIVWTPDRLATSYNIYGRTSGSELFLANVTAFSHWDDQGTPSPSGALPSTNTTGYDSTKTSKGTLIYQYSGAGAEDDFIGPAKISVFRPMEMTGALASMYPHVIPWSRDIDWVFMIENSTGASAARRVMFAEFSRSTSTFTYKGSIILTLTAATANTQRGFRMLRYTYNTGSVSSSGTAITGSGTAWQTARFSVGARIGFGATDPQFVPSNNWHAISAIGSDTSITVSGAGPSPALPAGTPFVIEELRPLVLVTNATVASGGLHLFKGINYADFSPSPITVPMGTTTDNIRAGFFFVDNTTTNTACTIGAGIALEPFSPTDYTTHYCYTVNASSASTVTVHKWNLRAALTVVSPGKSLSGLVATTATISNTSGVTSQVNNCRYAVLNHGPGAGQGSIYFVTTTRINRILTANVTPGSNNFIADAMLENPPGTSTTFALTAALSAVEVAGDIDRLLITSSGAAGLRSYVSQYRTDNGQMDHIFLVEAKQFNQGTSDSGITSFPAIHASPMSLWSEEGMLFIIPNSTSATANQMHNVPLAADWAYAASNNQRVITPEMSTPGASRFYRVLVTEDKLLGDSVLGTPTEPFRIYYRTSGITDNSGSWTLIDATGDLSAIGTASSIQFMFEFRVIGQFCIPARIHSLAVLYETTDSLPSQFEWNVSDSSTTDGTMGFSQISLFSSSVPDLQIDYYRSDTNVNVLTQTSANTTNGAFQYYNGSIWVNGLSTDVVGTRRRFVPSAGLPTGVNVYAKIKTI